MRKKILGFVFAAALLVAMAVPLFGGGGTAEAIVNPNVPIDCGNANSSGAAGGDAAGPTLTSLPAAASGFPGLPLPAQGNAHAPDPNPCLP